MSAIPDRASLPTMHHGVRTVRTGTAAATRGCDGLWVTKPVNVRWLSGFTGSNGQILLTADGRMTLFTDGRYSEQSRLELDAAGVEAEVVITRAPLDELATRWNGNALGVESHHLTVDALTALGSSLGAELTFVEVGPLIDQLRQTKDAGEVARLQMAAAIADTALARQEDVVLTGGVSERALARSLEAAMFELGADGLSFDTIVASGENSARPHARPGDRLLEPGDLVVIDFGASIDGYGSDMTRTFVCGGRPSGRQVELHDAVLRAQERGKAAVVAGVEQLDVDRACRDSLTADGLGAAFVHGTGHGIGLEIHEQPIVSPRSVGILSADMVVTVEPGVYLSGVGGVRVEDSVVVTDTGCDPITHFPKGLVPWPLSRPTT